MSSYSSPDASYHLNLEPIYPGVNSSVVMSGYPTNTQCGGNPNEYRMKKNRRKNTRKRNTRKRNTRKRNTRNKNTRKRNTRKRNTRKRNTRNKNTRKRNGGMKPALQRSASVAGPQLRRTASAMARGTRRFGDASREAMDVFAEGFAEGTVEHVDDENSAFRATGRLFNSLDSQTQSRIATGTAGRVQQLRSQRQLQAPQVINFPVDTPELSLPYEPPAVQGETGSQQPFPLLAQGITDEGTRPFIQAPADSVIQVDDYDDEGFDPSDLEGTTDYVPLPK